jgi:2-polyprenyl-3-methyl-5-hydroxy-6-metoxy-1,4-benzoquinol methylase
LREIFRLEPKLELYRYQIERSPAAEQRARDYLASICSEGPLLNNRFPVILIHYQGNTSCDKKDLSHEVARRTCETVRELGHVPVILDWDHRSPLIDQKTIHCPQADHALWGGQGTGDAEALAALIEASSLLVGIDSGPLHVAGATSTPSLGVWTRHHPIHYFDLCPNVKHLVPRTQARLARGSAAVEFFTKHYDHEEYDDLERDLPAQVRSQLTGEPISPKAALQPTITAEASTPKPRERILTSVNYDRQYYEEHQQAGLDYLNFGDWQQRYGRWFVESFKFQGKRVLDVGCACGSILRGLGEAGAVVAGVDLSEQMIELGRKKWPDMVPLLNVADAAHLSQFGNSSWEGIHSAQVAEHWEPTAVPQILRELNRIVAPGGLFFCSLDTEELFARQKRDMSTEDPTHICVKPRAWWTEQLAKAGWTDVTAEYEPALLDHHDSFLKQYDWDYFIARKEPQELPIGSYDLDRYPADCWALPMGSIDRRHLYWMYDILAAGECEHALEIGCLNGASSTVFIEAMNRQLLQETTFCDIHLRPTFRSVIDRASDRARIHTFEGRSVDLLTHSTETFDFVFIDGDHCFATVASEVDHLIARRPVCVMAHDTNLQALGVGDSDGPPYLKWRFQTAPGYYCLEDSIVRPAEETARGMFFATTSPELFEAARTSLAKWGAPPVVGRSPSIGKSPPVREASVDAESRVTVICATSGRPTLRRALESLVRQAWQPCDEVWLIHDGPAAQWVGELWSELGLPGRFVEMADGPHGDWGHTPRNRYLPEVSFGHVVSLDDDDALAPFAIETIRELVSRQPNDCFMFRADYRQGFTLGFEPELRVGNVSTGQFVHPASLELGKYGARYIGDFDFITATLEKNPASKLVWRPEATYVGRLHDAWRNPAFIPGHEQTGTKGREDLQSGWHSFFGNGFRHQSILDVGAGLGHSKGRLATNGNHVTTLDNGPDLPVDLHSDVVDLADASFDVVTAFDVIEHVDDDFGFVAQLLRVARTAVVLTTPNIWVSHCDNPYHIREYSPALLLDLLFTFPDIIRVDTFASADSSGANPTLLRPSQFLGTELPVLGVVLWKSTNTPNVWKEATLMDLDQG